MGVHHAASEETAHQIGFLDFRDAEYDYDSRDSSHFTSIPIYANEEFALGRCSSDGKCHLSESGGVSVTISKRHLKIHSVVYDDSIAPLVYAEDMSSNGTYLQRANRRQCPHDNARGILMGRKIKSTLLEHNDELWPTPRIVLRYCDSDHVLKRFDHEGLDQGPIHAADTKTIENRYLVTDRILGAGGHGRVYVAIHRKTQQQQACKVSDLTDLQLEGGRALLGSSSACQSKASGAKPKSAVLEFLFRECRVLKDLDHPNIIRLEKVYFSINGIYIFQELITGGDLFSFIMKRGDFGIPTVEAAVILRQVLKGLEYLHDRNIVHRDIKPDNILLTSTKGSYRVVLTDFGSARKICDASATGENKRDKQRLFSMVGTAEFVAPEVCAPNKIIEESSGYSGKAVDMWSVGCIASALISGDVFYVDRAHPELQENPNRVILDMARNVDLAVLDKHPNWKHVGPRAKDFIKRALVLDESARMTVKDALAHPWFTNKTYAEDHEILYQHSIKDWKPRQQTFRIMEFIESERPKMALHRSQLFSASRVASPSPSRSMGHGQGTLQGGLSTIQEEVTSTSPRTLDPSYDDDVTQGEDLTQCTQVSQHPRPHAAQLNAALAQGLAESSTHASPSAPSFNVATTHEHSTLNNQTYSPPFSSSVACVPMSLVNSTPILPPPSYTLDTATSEPSKLLPARINSYTYASEFDIPAVPPPSTVYDTLPTQKPQLRDPMPIFPPPDLLSPSQSSFPHSNKENEVPHRPTRIPSSSLSSGKRSRSWQRSFDFDYDGGIDDVDLIQVQQQQQQQTQVEAVTEVVFDNFPDPAAKRVRSRYSYR